MTSLSSFIISISLTLGKVRKPSSPPLTFLIKSLIETRGSSCAGHRKRWEEEEEEGGERKRRARRRLSDLGGGLNDTFSTAVCPVWQTYCHFYDVKCHIFFEEN